MTKWDDRLGDEPLLFRPPAEDIEKFSLYFHGTSLGFVINPSLPPGTILFRGEDGHPMAVTFRGEGEADGR